MSCELRLGTASAVIISYIKLFYFTFGHWTRQDVWNSLFQQCALDLVFNVIFLIFLFIPPTNLIIHFINGIIDGFYQLRKRELLIFKALLFRSFRSHKLYIIPIIRLPNNCISILKTSTNLTLKLLRIFYNGLSKMPSLTIASSSKILNSRYTALSLSIIYKIFSHKH